MKSLRNLCAGTVKDRVVKAHLSPLEHQIHKCILREFAQKGRAPTSLEIAEGLALSSADEVIQALNKLQCADILSRQKDKIVLAYPFSAIATRHKVVFEDGHEVFALCATDALGVHFMLASNIIVLSRCPECGKEIRITVKDERITSRCPEGIIEFRSNVERERCTAKNLCPFINFFCSQEHLKKWQEKNPKYRNGKVCSLDKALEQGKIIFGDLLK